MSLWLAYFGHEPVIFSLSFRADMILDLVISRCVPDQVLDLFYLIYDVLGIFIMTSIGRDAYTWTPRATRRVMHWLAQAT